MMKQSKSIGHIAAGAFVIMLSCIAITMVVHHLPAKPSREQLPPDRGFTASMAAPTPPNNWIWTDLKTTAEFWRYSNPDVGDTADQLIASSTRWLKTVPLERSIPSPGDFSAGGKNPSIHIRTDQAADPLRAGSISAASAEALCYSDLTIVIVHLKLSAFPVKCWFDEKITVNGQEFLSCSAAHFGDFPSFEYVISCETQPLGKDTQTVDATFNANIKAAAAAQFDEVWGRSILFRNIPLSRRELRFSLTQWRVQQKERDRKAAAMKAALEKM